MKTDKEEEKITKIYLIDDHPIVLKGLSHFFNASSDYTVCGYSTEMSAAREQISTLSPDIVIVDLVLKDQTGFELISWIVEHHKNIKILIHSMHTDDSYVERAFRAGARGYVTKHEPVENIVIAIQELLNNKIYLNNESKDRLLVRLINQNLEITHDPVRQLTNREFAVFHKMGKGYSIKEIAQSLNLSVKTIQTYRERIKEKLNIRKSNDLVHYAHLWATTNEK